MLYTARTFSFEHPAPEADICLLGVPFSSTQIGHPVKYGPLFIREAIKSLPGWDPELGVNIFEELRFCDLGDLEVVPGSWELTTKALEDTMEELHQQNPSALPVILGGEHLVTLGVLEALSKHHKKITVVHLDAHRDLMPDWIGNTHSHITWARLACQNPRIKIVQPACRSWYPDEEKAVREFGIRDTLDGISGPVYLSVDLDVLDPSLAPEVGTPEPSGISLEKLFSIIRNVSRNKLVGIDIVECAADRVNTPTALAAAAIFKKTLGYMIKYGQKS